jgi:hypothetical protein
MQHNNNNNNNNTHSNNTNKSFIKRSELKQHQNTLNILTDLIVSWVQKYDYTFTILPLTQHLHANIHKLIEITEDLLEEMVDNTTPSYNNAHQLLIPVIIYAERFVKKFGIHYEQVLNLLVICAIIAVKFWEDGNDFTNADVAEAYNYSVAQINAMEWHILAGIEFRLCISTDEMLDFINNTINVWESSDSSSDDASDDEEEEEEQEEEEMLLVVNRRYSSDTSSLASTSSTSSLSSTSSSSTSSLPSSTSSSPPPPLSPASSSKNFPKKTYFLRDNNKKAKVLDE